MDKAQKGKKLQRDSGGWIVRMNMDWGLTIWLRLSRWMIINCFARK